VSLISDSNIPSQELFYLRYLFSQHSRCSFSVLATVFRYLWDTYGFNLSNSSNSVLRYSGIAKAAIDHTLRIKGNIPPEYYEYVSQYHEDLLFAIGQNKVDEMHLFALCLAVHNARLYSFYFCKESTAYYTYLDLFCVTLQHMIDQHLLDRTHPLKAIWSSTLSLLRRTYLYPQGIASLTQDSDIQLHRMYLLSTKLPPGHCFDEILNPSIEPSLYFAENGGKFFVHCCWNICDVLCSLQSCFRIIYRRRERRPSDLQTEHDFRQLLQSIQTRSNEFERLRPLDKVFEVRPYKDMSLTI